MSTDIFKRVLPLAIIIALLVLAWALDLTSFITLESLKLQRENLLDLVTRYPVLSIIGFISIYILS
ncbi:MAG: TVP38/TMEM64 family protein, partial [Gammaproteobacteria bacterium]